MQTLGEILEFIKQKDTNIKLISKETGISSDRLYSWRQGRGTPKAEDAYKLREWAKRKWGNSNKIEEVQSKVEEVATNYKAPDVTQELINSLKKNIEILERVNEDQADRVNRLLKSNSDLMLQLQTNLENLTRNHLTSHAMNEAFHEEIVDLLLKLSKQPAAVKMTLIENVHNTGVEKMLAFSRTGNLVDSHT